MRKLLFRWQINIKLGAVIWYTVRGNKTMVVFYYFFYNGKADTRAFKMRPVLQALEQLKNPFAVFWIKANSIICNFYVAVFFGRIKLIVIKNTT